MDLAPTHPLPVEGDDAGRPGHAHRTGRASRGRLRRLVSSPTGVAALSAVTLLLLLAALGPVLFGDRAEAFNTDAITAGPSFEHLLGTDNLGRDILARVLVATRLSVGLAIAATLIGLVGGVLLGALGSVAGVRVARWTAAVIGVAVAFPGLLLAIFFAVIFGVGKLGAVLALGIAAIPYFARLTQTLIASVNELDFVSAARAMGVGRFTILRRHVLPNIGEPLVVNAAMGAGNHLLAFAGLSYLGIGVQAPGYDWGRLLLEGVANIYSNPAGALGPGVAIAIAGLAFNLTGEVTASSLGGRGGRTPARPAHGVPTTRSPLTPPAPPRGDTVLTVRDLRVRLPAGTGWVEAVRGVDLDLAPGQTLGLVGESGSGKSLTAMAVAGLLPVSLDAEAAVLGFEGHDLREASPRERRRLLADSMSVIFQDPMSSLNPTMRVGTQLAEVAREHQGATRAEARQRAVEVLGQVRIPRPGQRARQYPHEFSGGMRQRAMIGIGVMGRPRLVIADEPTTALDVTVQQQILDLLDRTGEETGAARILISHDVSVIASRSHMVAVMYAGRIVEQLRADRLHLEPRHPYTRALLRAVPDMTTDRERPLATIPGRPPRPEEMPPGCAYAARCPMATQHCREADPGLVWADGAAVACWNPQSGPIASEEPR